jgi:hypothetical protein
MLILVPVLHLAPRHEVVSEVHKSSYAHLPLDGDDWVDSRSSRFIPEEYTLNTLRTGIGRKEYVYAPVWHGTTIPLLSRAYFLCAEWELTH